MKSVPDFSLNFLVDLDYIWLESFIDPVVTAGKREAAYLTMMAGILIAASKIIWAVWIAQPNEGNG